MIATNSIDLAGGTGNGYIDFGNQTWLDNLPRWTVLIGCGKKATVWYSAARQLWGRWGSSAALRQALIQVGPSSGGFTARLQLNPPSGSVCIRDYQGAMYGKTLYQIMARVQLDLGLVDMMIDGNFVPLVGSIAVPTALRIPSSQSWRVGGTDLLQDLVSQHAFWPSALTDDQMRAVWNRGLEADLRDPSQLGPTGIRVPVPQPLVWWPLGTSDVIPTARPRIGTVQGSIQQANGTPTGALNTLVSRCPIKDLNNNPSDPVAVYRFEIAGWNDQGPDPRQHNGMPCLLKTGVPGELLIARSKGVQHLANNQDIFLDRSLDLGKTWPWPNGQVWPTEPQSTAEVCIFDTATQGPFHDDASARGNIIHRFKNGPYAGRIIHFCNYVLNPEPPLGQIQRYVLSCYSDDDDVTRTDWIQTVTLGTQWTGTGGGDGSIELDDGTLYVPVYYRNLVPGSSPPSSEGYYVSQFLKTTDGGQTFTASTVIANGAPNFQWEEPKGGVFRYAQGAYAAGTMMVLLRRDYDPDHPSYPPQTFRSYSTNGIDGPWSAPVLCFDGANWPVWIQLEYDPEHTILCLTRSANDPGHCELRYTKDGGATWSAPIDLAENGIDGSDVGHSLLETQEDFTQPDGTVVSRGTVLVVQAHERLNAQFTTARTQYLQLKKLW